MMKMRTVITILLILLTSTIAMGFSLYSQVGTCGSYDILEAPAWSPHDGQYYGKVIVFYPPGSGQNGPQHLESGLGVSVIKDDWPQNSVAAELNGINVAVRNGNGDGSGVMVDIATNDDSHIAAWEASTTKLAQNGWPIIAQLRTQAGVMNVYGITGFFTALERGSGGTAFKAHGDFDNFLVFSTPHGIVAKLDRNGNLYLKGQVIEQAW